MSISIGAALKRVALSLLTNPKVLKKALGIILGAVIVLVMPIASVVATLNGNIEIDTNRLQTIVVENLSAEEKARLRAVEKNMTSISTAMKAAGYDDRQSQSAQVLYVTSLYDYATDRNFVKKLVGCYAKGQTDAQLITKVNSTFGTDITAKDFTTFMNSIHKKIVSVALSQVGNKGGQPYWSWYGFRTRVEWCACFVSWCADKAGLIEAGSIPKFSGCGDGVRWFKEHDQWLDGKKAPASGMIIFFDWNNQGDSGPQDGLPDHVGIVDKVENGVVYTIEGNSGDECKQRQYPVGYSEILGYGTYNLKTPTV